MRQIKNMEEVFIGFRFFWSGAQSFRRLNILSKFWIEITIALKGHLVHLQPFFTCIQCPLPFLANLYISET
jgi:hypothetical protein